MKKIDIRIYMETEGRTLEKKEEDFLKESAIALMKDCGYTAVGDIVIREDDYFGVDLMNWEFSFEKPPIYTSEEMFKLLDILEMTMSLIDLQMHDSQVSLPLN